MKSFKLDEHKKQDHPFQVEPGFFDKLNQSIQERVSSEPQSISWTSKLAPQLRLAFMMAMVVSAGLFYLLFSNESTQTNYLADVTDEEILIYLSNYELTQDELSLLVEISDLESLPEIEDEFLNLDMDDEALEDLYLEYQNPEDMLEI